MKRSLYVKLNVVSSHILSKKMSGKEDILKVFQPHPLGFEPFELYDIRKGQPNGHENGVGKEQAYANDPGNQEDIGFQGPFPVDAHALGLPGRSRLTHRTHRLLSSVLIDRPSRPSSPWRAQCRPPSGPPPGRN